MCVFKCICISIVYIVFSFSDIKFNNGRVKNQETIDLKIKSNLLVL